MTIQQRRRRCRTLALAAFCLSVVAPSFAGALTVDLNPVVDTQSVEGAVDKAAETVKPVTEVLRPVQDTVEPVRDAVAPVTDSVEEPVREVVDPVTEVLQPVRDAVDPVTDVVEEPVREVVDPVTDVVTDPLPGRPSVVVDPLAPTGSGIAGDRGSAGLGSRSAPSAPTGPATNPRERDTVEALPVLPGLSVPAGAAAALDSSQARNGATAASPAVTAGRVLRDAAIAFRFPLLVSVAVLLFLAVQSRMDRRDPKLAISTDDEELHFA